MNQGQYQEMLRKDIMENLDNMQDMIEIIQEGLQEGDGRKAYKDTEHLQRMTVGTLGLISGMVTVEAINLAGGFKK